MASGEGVTPITTLADTHSANIHTYFQPANLDISFNAK